MRKSVNIAKRISNKIKHTDNGCMIWTGSLNGRMNTPVVAKDGFSGGIINVRRYLYLKENYLTQKQKVQPSCNNVRCVSPKHAKIVENKATWTVAKSRALMCGTPPDFYVANSCPNCDKMKTRECLKCNKSFEPGCKVRFTCPDCYTSTITHRKVNDDPGSYTDW